MGPEPRQASGEAEVSVPITGTKKSPRSSASLVLSTEAQAGAVQHSPPAHTVAPAAGKKVPGGVAQLSLWCQGTDIRLNSPVYGAGGSG